MKILCVGHAVQDLLFRVDKIPTTPEKHAASDLELVGGGPAANAAVAISRLGGSARLASRVGDDPIGDTIVRDLEHEGVDCSLVNRLGNCQSSLSAVSVDPNGERLIVNFLDARMPDSPEWLDRHFPEDVDAVLADTRWPRGAACALRRAAALGIPGVLDADHPIPRDPDLLRTASHIAFSAQGLIQRSGATDLPSGLARMGDTHGGWMCVTDGAKGVHVRCGEELVHVPACSTRAVDTLAAGDVWHGAFAFELCRNGSELEAVRFANAAAALKVSREGGRNGAPSLDEVEDFLQLPGN